MCVAKPVLVSHVCAKHGVKKGEVVVSEEDTEPGLRILGQHESRGLQIEVLEQGVVPGFEINPVEGGRESSIVDVLFILGQRIKGFLG